MKSIKKWTVLIILDCVVIIVILFGLTLFLKPPAIKINGVFINHPKEVTDFYLIDQQGRSFTQQQLKGHWSLLFFGFTRCPNICPTTLDALNKMYVLLQKKLPARLLPQVIFISIDPEKDTLAVIRQFVGAYNKHFIGAIADTRKTTDLKKQFAISAVDRNGSIDHTTDIILINPQAQIQAYFLYPHRPDSMANDYLQIVNTVSLN